MIVISIFVSVLTIGSTASAADNLNDYEGMCKTDPLCSRLKDARGNFIPVSAPLKRLLEEGRDVFIDHAERYGVDPRAVAGAIAAENTMNVQASDLVQGWLAHRGITGVGSKQFSFGFGQINMPAALEAERHLAKIDGRPEKSTAQIREALLTMDGAVYYATGIVRKAQDDYKAKGIDISKRPDVLASLYNLGKTEERAVAAATSGKKPQVNYFGFFVAQNLGDVTSALGWDPKEGKRTKPRVSEQLTKDTGSFSTGSTGLTLLTSPPSCNLDGRAEAGRYNAVLTAREYPPAGTAQGLFKVVGRGVDCDLKDYVRVQFDSGKRGWIQAAMLHDQDSGITRSSSAPVLKCSQSEAKACMEKLRVLVGKDAPGIQDASPSQDNQLSLDLVTTDGKPLTASYKNASLGTCEDTQGFFGGMNSGSTTATPELLDKVLEKSKSLKASIVERLGLKDWDDPDNPIGRFDFFQESELEDCKKNPKACSFQIYKASGGNSYSSQNNYTLDNFLEMDAKKMDTRDLLLLIKGKRFSLNNSGTSNSFEDFDKQRKDAGEAAVRECQQPLAETKTTNSLEKAVKKINAFDEKQFKNYNYDATSWMATLSAMAGKCKALNALLSGADTKLFEGTELNVSDGKNSAMMKVSLIKKLQPGKESLLNGFKKVITDLEESVGNAMPDGQTKCTYDPFATAALASKLAGEACVEQVYVPDQFIPIALLKSGSSKIVYDESDEQHISLQLKGCAPRGSYRFGDPVRAWSTR